MKKYCKWPFKNHREYLPLYKSFLYINLLKFYINGIDAIVCVAVLFYFFKFNCIKCRIKCYNKYNKKNILCFVLEQTWPETWFINNINGITNVVVDYCVCRPFYS